VQKSPYLQKGRLADVIAALQVMGAGPRPEAEISNWAKELSGSDASEQIERWTKVFIEHPEFFLTYVLDDNPNQKAALRWRYTNKLYDPRTGKDFTQEQKEALPLQDQWRLTTKPLTSDAIGALMNTAIELHSRAMEELAARRWWVPVFAAFLGFTGAVLGAVVAAIWGHHRQG
jgi:hypothetical protein